MVTSAAMKRAVRQREEDGGTLQLVSLSQPLCSSCDIIQVHPGKPGLPPQHPQWLRHERAAVRFTYIPNKESVSTWQAGKSNSSNIRYQSKSKTPQSQWTDALKQSKWHQKASVSSGKYQRDETYRAAVTYRISHCAIITAVGGRNDDEIIDILDRGEHRVWRYNRGTKRLTAAGQQTPDGTDGTRKKPTKRSKKDSFLQRSERSQGSFYVRPT